MWLDKNKPGYYLGGINKVKFKKTSTWLFKYQKNGETFPRKMFPLIWNMDGLDTCRIIFQVFWRESSRRPREWRTLYSWGKSMPSLWEGAAQPFLATESQSKGSHPAPIVQFF